MIRFALDGGYSLRSLEEGDVAELHAVVAANREHLARWMPWAREQTEQRPSSDTGLRGRAGR